MQQQERRLALRLAVSLPHPPPTHQPRAGEEKGLTGLVQASSTEQRKLFMELRGTVDNLHKCCTEADRALHAHPPVRRPPEHFHSVKGPGPSSAASHSCSPSKGRRPCPRVGRFLEKALPCQLCLRPRRASDLRSPSWHPRTLSGLHSTRSLLLLSGSECKTSPSSREYEVCVSQSPCPFKRISEKEEKYLKSEVSGQKL